MLVDAIILTGGRSSRLDGVPKAEFVVEKSTLLERTLRAVNGAHRIVVVGDAPSTALPEGVMLAREEPPFSGPVAAIAAGIAALTPSTDDSRMEATDAFLVLACDMPHIGHAVPQLLRALDALLGAAPGAVSGAAPGAVSGAAPDAASGADGVIAVDADGRRQPLAAVYRKDALVAALDAIVGDSHDPDPLAGLPMFRLVDHLKLIEVQSNHEATEDVDTWDDAMRLGAQPPGAQPSPRPTPNRLE